MRKIVSLALLLSIGSLGCGAIRPHVVYTSFGQADPEKDESVVKAYEKGSEKTSDDDVVVLVDTIPEGIEIGLGTITIKDGYRHQLVGKFGVNPGFGGGPLALYWFADYETGWRKGYCYPQVVLNWLTLSLWMAVPLSYVCNGDASLTKAAVIRQTKALARSAGGNLVIMGWSGAGIDSNPNVVWGASGFILRADPKFKKVEQDVTPGGTVAPKTL
jgi:hypothetical protein